MMSYNKEGNETAVEQMFGNNGRPFLMVLVGKSFRGKSYLLKMLLTYFLMSGKLKYGLVFTRTKFNHEYTSFLPDSRVIGDYDEDILEKYMNNLKKMKDNGDEPENNFVIFDDLSGVLTTDSKKFQSFVSTFRHTNTYVFIAIQYLKGRNSMSTTMREQCDYFVMFRPNTHLSYEGLFENCGGMYKNLEDFKDRLISATEEEHTACVYSCHNDDMDTNYVPIQAPKDYDKIKFNF